ncbi:glycosyltransferase family 87 protein [Salinibaculum marinum]|uniref:glycosyltransferase family 87 protein n=1 Tax=Salinibaculum marinum TaxID=3131993 RepID=UPI0030D20573
MPGRCSDSATSATRWSRTPAIGINFDVYRAAAADLWAGERVYGHSPIGNSDFTYRYPPVLLVWFSAYLLVPPVAGYLVHVLGTLAAGAALGYLLVGETERLGATLATADRALVVGFATVGSYVAPSLLYGNVNHHVGLAVAGGLVLLSSSRKALAGATLALAALPKVFPAGVGAWLLWRREWLATAAALATGLGALAAGAVLFGPARTWRYFTTELLPRAGSGAFAGGLPATSELVSLRRPLSVLVPGAGETALAVAALAVVAPVVLYVYSGASGETGRLVAVFVTLACLLVVLPSYSLYWAVLLYPLVPLLYVLDSPAGDLFAAGALVTTLTLKLPDVAVLVRSLPLPEETAGVLLAGAEAVYTVGTPVLWGTAAMVAACVWWTATE